jgi:MFS family permease
MTTTLILSALALRNTSSAPSAGKSERKEMVTEARHGGREELAAANRAPLDWLNFLLGNVKDGLGPFLAIFLMSSQHWDARSIGVVLTISGVTTALTRGPFGALVDVVRWKRTLIAIGVLTVAIAAVAMALTPKFWPVVVAQVFTGLADAIFPSAVAAISLGIGGRKMFTHRVGRNEAYNHAGNVTTAIVAGLAGYLIDPSAVLWIVAGLAVACGVSAYAVDPGAIDHDVARGADDGDHGRSETSGLKVLLENRTLLLFTAVITLFHFANAAMLPLVGEKLAQSNHETSSLFMASCIIAAQMVMVPMAILVGQKADTWGRKPIFLAGFAVLPLRGVLYTLTQDPTALVAIQLLDGIGAGIFGALFFIVVADLTRGTGRYNLALGAAGACWGLGAAFSNGVAGFIVNAFGFSAAFLFLSACALVAVLLFWLGVPETREMATEAPAEDAKPLPASAVAGT